MDSEEILNVTKYIMNSIRQKKINKSMLRRDITKIDNDIFELILKDGAFMLKRATEGT